MNFTGSAALVSGGGGVGGTSARQAQFGMGWPYLSRRPFVRRASPGNWGLPRLTLLATTERRGGSAASNRLRQRARHVPGQRERSRGGALSALPKAKHRGHSARHGGLPGDGRTGSFRALRRLETLRSGVCGERPNKDPQRGVIKNSASTAAFHVEARQTAYPASKAAIVG